MAVLSGRIWKIQKRVALKAVKNAKIYRRKTTALAGGRVFCFRNWQFFKIKPRWINVYFKMVK
jgi:hypothetical protein